MSIETLEALAMEGLAFFREIETRADLGDLTPAFCVEALQALNLIERLQVEPGTLRALRETLIQASTTAA